MCDRLYGLNLLCPISLPLPTKEARTVDSSYPIEIKISNTANEIGEGGVPSGLKILLYRLGGMVRFGIGVSLLAITYGFRKSSVAPMDSGIRYKPGYLSKH